MSAKQPPSTHHGLAGKLAWLTAERRALLERKLQEKLLPAPVALVRGLAALGITHIYGISGTPIIETLAAAAAAGVRVIGVHHQQAAVLMACAHNYTRGRLAAVALVSAGPAITNALTGALVARDNAWPVLILGGQRSVDAGIHGQFQEFDGVPLYQGVCKWSARVDSIAALGQSLAHAAELATRGRPGPVYLGLPEDVLNQRIGDFVPPQPACVAPPAPAAAQVEYAAQLLLEAKRPGLIIGKGLRWNDAHAQLAALMQALPLPFITSPMGQGYLPDDHPLCCNAARSHFQSGADTLLLLGARLDWTFRFGSEFAPDVRLIQVDIHADEIGRNRVPTLGIHADAGLFLQALTVRLAARLSSKETRSDCGPWLTELDRQRQRALAELERHCRDERLPLAPARLAAEVRAHLPPEAICVLDGSVSMGAAQKILPAHQPATRLTAGSNGCMGVGIPFGIGAKLARPDAPVIVLSGDMAFGVNAMELETAVRHRIPLIVIVANNQGLSGALNHTRHYPRPDAEPVTLFQPDIRYEQMAIALGAHGEFVEQPHDIGPALQRALAAGKPACINVRVDPHAAHL